MKIDYYSIGNHGFEVRYVIILAIYRGKIIFVMHKKRTTWEMPAGHIEKGETPEEAAARELYEETGSTEFQIFPVCDAVIAGVSKEICSRLFLAEVKSLGKLDDYEIAKVDFFDWIPANLTYSIQKEFIEVIQQKTGKKFL